MKFYVLGTLYDPEGFVKKTYTRLGTFYTPSPFPGFSTPDTQSGSTVPVLLV